MSDNNINLDILTPERLAWYVNVYEVDRAYGGGEEGGWFYDEGTLLESKCFDYWGECDEDRGQQYVRAVNYAKEVQAKFNSTEPVYATGMGEHDGVDNAGNPNDSFLIRGGHWGNSKIRIVVEPVKGADYPMQRPTYE